MGADVLHPGLLSFPAPLADAGLLVVFLLAAGVTAMAGVGFVLWSAYHIIRIVVLILARLVLLPTGHRPRRSPPPVRRVWLACPDPVCRTINPDHARFCRQCGRMMHRPVHLAA